MRLKREMNARTSNVERGKGRVGPIVHSRSETTRKSSGKDEESREDFEFFGEDACSEKVLRRVTGEEDLRTVQVLFLTVDTNIVQVDHLGVQLPSLIELRLERGSTLASFRDFGNSMAHLRVLWLSACGVCHLDGVGALVGLEELYLAFNEVQDLTSIALHDRLEVLDLESNSVEEADQMMHLGTCQRLWSLNLTANPIARDHHYRSMVINAVPHLVSLDEEDISGRCPHFTSDTHDTDGQVLTSAHGIGPRTCLGGETDVPVDAVDGRASLLDLQGTDEKSGPDVSVRMDVLCVSAAGDCGGRGIDDVSDDAANDVDPLSAAGNIGGARRKSDTICAKSSFVCSTHSAEGTYLRDGGTSPRLDEGDTIESGTSAVDRHRTGKIGDIKRDGRDEQEIPGERGRQVMVARGRHSPCGADNALVVNEGEIVAESIKSSRLVPRGRSTRSLRAWASVIRPCVSRRASNSIECDACMNDELCPFQHAAEGHGQGKELDGRSIDFNEKARLREVARQGVQERTVSDQGDERRVEHHAWKRSGWLFKILELEDFASADGDASKSAPVGVGKVASSALTHGSEVSIAGNPAIGLRRRHSPHREFDKTERACIDCWCPSGAISKKRPATTCLCKSNAGGLRRTGHPRPATAGEFFIKLDIRSCDRGRLAYEPAPEQSQLLHNGSSESVHGESDGVAGRVEAVCGLRDSDDDRGKAATGSRELGNSVFYGDLEDNFKVRGRGMLSSEATSLSNGLRPSPKEQRHRHGLTRIVHSCSSSGLTAVARGVDDLVSSASDKIERARELARCSSASGLATSLKRRDIPVGEHTTVRGEYRRKPPTIVSAPKIHHLLPRSDTMDCDPWRRTCSDFWDCDHRCMRSYPAFASGHADACSPRTIVCLHQRMQRQWTKDRRRRAHSLDNKPERTRGVRKGKLYTPGRQTTSCERSGRLSDVHDEAFDVDRVGEARRQHELRLRASTRGGMGEEVGKEPWQCFGFVRASCVVPECSGSLETLRIRNGDSDRTAHPCC